MLERFYLAHLGKMMQPDKPNWIEHEQIENVQTPSCLAGDISL